VITPLRIPLRLWAPALLVLAAACSSSSPPAGPAPLTARGAQGDSVSIVQYHVRPQARAQFESFLRESYWPAVQQLARTDPERVRGFLQARILFPARANPDGTFTYVFLLDPMISGQSYYIRELLRQVHPAQEADRRYSAWAQTWNLTSQVLVQSAPAAADSTAQTAGRP
jgi:hypothetical protein